MSNLIFDNNTLKTYTSSISNHTDDQINKKIINPNLLINADFSSGISSIVNQRGFMQYSSTNQAYSIDRWIIGSANGGSGQITILSDGLELKTLTSGSGWITQIIEFPEKLIGKVITVSAVVTSSIGVSMITASGIVATSNPTVIRALHPDYDIGNHLEFYHSGTNGFSYVNINTNSSVGFQIQRVKLEVGNVSTLLNDPPQDYAEELRKCQRYLQSITTTDARMAYRTNDVLQFGLFLATPMRIQPSIINGVDGDTLIIWDVNTNQLPTGFSYNFSYTPGSVGGYLSAWKTNHGIMDATFYTTNTRPVLLSAEM